MKFRLFLPAIIFLAVGAHAQGLDHNLKMAANDIAQKITKKNKTRIAVADFVNNAGKSDALTKYITEQFEMGLINAEGDIQVMDRKHIQQLLSDNHLQSQGLIDESTAKSAVEFIKVDGWAFGEITSFGDQIKISVKIIDVTTSLIYAAFMSELISDPSIKKFTQSTEEQSEPVNKECLEKNTGDFCFINAGTYAIQSSASVSIILDGQAPNYKRYNLTVLPGETGCVYDLLSGPYTYNYSFSTGRVGDGPLVYIGQIKVERCKSTAFKIN